MNIIFVLAVTMCFEKSGSQTLTKTQLCFSDGHILTLNCDTPAVNETISFTLNGGNQGACSPGLGCGTNIAQTGTTTSLTIPLYNGTEHGGSWRCTFGSLLSPVVIIAENPCASTNPDKSCGIHPLWCVLGSLIGSLVSILLYRLYRWCIHLPKKYWKTIYLLIAVGIAVCSIAAGIACYFICFENGWYNFGLVCLFSFLLTSIWIAIVYNCAKSKGNTNTSNQPLTLGNTNTSNQPFTLDTTKSNDQNPTPVPSEKVMLLVKSVDTGIISAFEWISEQGNLSKDRDRNKLKYSFGSSLKVSLVINSLSKEDNGIYQCVRTLPQEVKDKINVVLCVSNTSPICLVVNPFVWEDQMFEDLSPVDLKKIVTKFDRNSLNEVIKTLNRHDGRNLDYVDWTCSTKPNEKVESKEINGSTILSATDAGEYRCTLHLNKKTYVFIFYIHYLDEKDSRPQTKEHVFGVPSMLNSNREESKTERTQKTRHTATSDGIHKEPIEDQVADFHLPHTIQKKTQQHDTP